MSDDWPYVVCCVLNWNNYEDSRDCIESLLNSEYKNLDILLIDNGSTDGSAQRLNEEFEDIECLFLKENLGFGGGHNRGIQWGLDHDADYIMLVNNDTLFPESELFNELVKTMEQHTNVGVLTPQIYYGPDSISQFRRGVIHFGTAKPRYEYPDVDPGSDLIDNDYVPFVAVLIRPAVFKTVGLHPEEYFMYYGDLDYCTQIRQAGFDIKTYLPGKVYHGESNTSGESIAPIRSYYNMRNRFIWARKFPELVHTPSFYKQVLIDLGYQSGRRIYYAEFAGLIAFLRGTLDGFRGRTGKGPYP